jgi:uncharacterized membrane protein
MMSDSGRVEAFSDGVFAIAITLLVLDLAVPPITEGGDLAHELAAEWPSYFAYLVSFLVIGIIWINHHAMFALVSKVDRRALFANLGLLLTISVIPFPTRLLAEYLLEPDAATAAVVYSATMVAMSVAFGGLWFALTRDARLLHHPIDAASRRRSIQRFTVGGIVYAATIGISFVSAPAVLAVDAAVALYYSFDQLAPARADRT